MYGVCSVTLPPRRVVRLAGPGRRPRVSTASAPDCGSALGCRCRMADMELRLQLGDLRLDLFLALLPPLLVERLARCPLRGTLGVLRGGDLGLHVVDVAADD